MAPDQVVAAGVQKEKIDQQPNDAPPRLLDCPREEEYNLLDEEKAEGPSS